MQQISDISIGTDITQMTGYLVYGNDRLGAFDIIFENVGPNTATILLKQYVGTNVAGNVSGYVPLGTYFTIAGNSITSTSAGTNSGVQGGTVTKHLNVIGKQLGIFGSGNTSVNASLVTRNRADRRGAQWDFIPAGRVGFGFDPGYNTSAFKPNWGPPPDAPNLPQG